MQGQNFYYRITALLDYQIRFMLVYFVSNFI